MFIILEIVHSLSTFGTWTSHEQTRTQETHQGLDLEEPTTFPLIVCSVPSHMTNTQMSFYFGTHTRKS
jgi:hypothetical protein